MTKGSGAATLGAPNRISDPEQENDRNVALTCFNRGYVAVGNTGSARELPARHTTMLTRGTDACAELYEKFGLGIREVNLLMNHRPR